VETAINKAKFILDRIEARWPAEPKSRIRNDWGPKPLTWRWQPGALRNGARP